MARCDGKIAECILYFNGTDVLRHQRLFEMDEHMTEVSRQMRTKNLWKVVSYCENKIECRRSMQLTHLGENKIGQSLCAASTDTACDNCLNNQAENAKYVHKDCINECRHIIKAVEELCD